ncbi:transcriptional regulator [Erwinia endophytica]|uniref:helix-turn-helix domain-containing protein n=1 Tax=Erwinia endophytica TaxID=1563158 RepID=UPI0012660305|nr:helix-turn-helix domain-containing protein [Erwinia endophytica]KAB8311948.1 transcriptional regulator [Erwinia endophytica]
MSSFLETNEKIINLLLPYAEKSEPDEISRGKRRYKFCKKEQRVVYLLLEGDYCLKVKEGNKILAIVSAPCVIGFMPTIEDIPLYLERVDYGKISHIDYDFFWRFVKDKNIIDDVMEVMSYQYTDLMSYISMNKCTSADEVRSLVHRWQKIPEHLKKRFSVMYLIENSSDLSKSSISRVLKEMKENSEISLDRGRFE